MKAVKKNLMALAVLAALGFSVFAVIQFGKPATPPLIQGVVLVSPQPLAAFSLQDHRGNSFTNARLQGQWTILSYGYTDCPDICPIILSELAKLERHLASDGKYEDVQVLFYTIDPQRDTVERLAQYVPYFSERFIGLAPGEQYADALPLERSLGIQSAITPMAPDESNFKGYTVSHGTMMYLLNPQGELQAIFKPQTTADGFQVFSNETLYEDYVALRKYFG